MPTDYEALHRGRDLEGELKRSVGLLADMYGDPSHFIIELLQNAEDAVGKRPTDWDGARTISFNITENSVEVSHFGRPFDEADVKGIVITLTSTKEGDFNAIGKFGVGFKSVYSITDRPEIHSGEEHFAIEDRLRPVGISPDLEHNPEHTIFRLPLNDRGQDGKQDVIDRLSNLGPETLLFLRHIDNIAWKASTGQKGKLRRRTETLRQNVRKVSITHEDVTGQVQSCQRWLVFSRSVRNGGVPAGYVEVAFQLSEQSYEGIQRLGESLLTVFFPTIVETGLGFLIQGPFRTTPNRENVPPADDWNKILMDEAAALIPDALRWLKSNRLLDGRVLDGFPIRDSYYQDERYCPLYDATKIALETQSLLPCVDGSYHPAKETRLGSTDAVRLLFTPHQLAELFGESGQLFWITGDITPDRLPDLRLYIRDELDVTDVTPDALIPLLRTGREFLESQTDDWVRGLYEFFGQQSGLHDRLGDVPLLRLDDERHVALQEDNSVFLPGGISHGSPTVQKNVCSTGAALGFLKALGLRERDLVDEVVEVILPKYEAEAADIADYDRDIQLIAQAYANVTTTRKDDFIANLCYSRFVKTVDASDGTKSLSQPSEVFLADDDQKQLFRGVSGVLFLDGTHECLNDPRVKELLIECDAVSPTDMASVVVKHVIPKYRSGTTSVDVDADTYACDIKRILTAYETIPNERRFSLLNPLRRAFVVQAVDTGNGSKSWRHPASVYLASDGLEKLFAGAHGVSMVDANECCLRGEKIGELLQACGVPSNLQVIRSYETTLTEPEKREMRLRITGSFSSTREERVDDLTLRGLGSLLLLLPTLDANERSAKAKLLWEELCKFADDCKRSDFFGTYKWHYFSPREAYFEAAFVKRLNDTRWVPDSAGELRHPQSVRFDTLGWTENEILQAKVKFQPPIVQELAREAGIDEEVLDLIQKANLTKADLPKFREWLESKKQGEQDSTPTKDNDSAPTPAPTSGYMSDENGSDPSKSYNGDGISAGNRGSSNDGFSSAGTGSSGHTSGNGGTRQFYSYVGVRPDGESDSDGAEHSARMELEEIAIEFILEQEPDWQRTDTNNPGFDLYVMDANGATIRWCEVKAMSGAYDSHPVGMTKRQFEEAQKRGEAFWLYVVEDAATDAPCIVRIQDPAGQARTFTFDQGWRDFAAEQDAN